MKPFKPNWSFHCLSKHGFIAQTYAFGIKSFFLASMGRIHAYCRKTDYVANMCFLGLFLTQIFMILLRFFSEFTQISVQKTGGWELCSQVDDIL